MTAVRVPYALTIAAVVVVVVGGVLLGCIAHWPG